MYSQAKPTNLNDIISELYKSSSVLKYIVCVLSLLLQQQQDT